MNAAIDASVNKITSRKEGVGYQGLPSGLAVVFDYGNSTDLGNPTYPYVTVQYN